MRAAFAKLVGPGRGGLPLLRERSVLALIVCFVVAMAGVLWHQAHVHDKAVRSAALQEANGMINSLREFRTLYTSEVVAVRTGTGSSAIADELKAALEEADVEYLAEEIPRAIGQSLNGIDRVRKIVQSMNEFSHPGGEGMTSLDLNHAVESTITVATNEWKYVAEMETDFDPELPAVLCLPGELNQVVLNMIVNAAHAIADVVGNGAQGMGTITVSTRRAGEFAEIRIADTGTGIPEEARGKIFDPFFTTKDVDKGTGQGLSIAYAVVVQKHGGTVDFETETGKGTTFIIRLPLERRGVEEPV